MATTFFSEPASSRPITSGFVYTRNELLNTSCAFRPTAISYAATATAVGIFCATSFAKLGPERNASRLWNSLDKNVSKPSDSGIQGHRFSMPFEALTMIASWGRKGASCFVTARTV